MVPEIHKPQTNRQKYFGNSVTNKELAKLLDTCIISCKHCPIKICTGNICKGFADEALCVDVLEHWLQSEYKECIK